MSVLVEALVLAKLNSGLGSTASWGTLPVMLCRGVGAPGVRFASVPLVPPPTLQLFAVVFSAHTARL